MDPKLLRVITLNINGIRAGARKGFFEWLKTQQADVICLQETKAQLSELDLEELNPPGYHLYFQDAIKKGYSGVAIYSRHHPDKVHYGLDWPKADNEGRYVQIDLGELSIASLYLPSGTSGDERQTFKYEFMAFYEQQLAEIAKQDRAFIVCGDWNIAHKKIDIKNWRGNQKHSGFLPEERAWLDKLFDEYGLVDAFRCINQEADQYTWWSNRGQAWAKNVGWRIDYQIITPNITDKISRAEIYKEQRFSDHAPLIMDYALNIKETSSLKASF